MMMGKPTVAGTRITVELILEFGGFELTICQQVSSHNITGSSEHLDCSRVKGRLANGGKLYSYGVVSDRNSEDDDGQADCYRNPHLVELILEKLAAGETVEQILAAQPRLTDEGIRAAIAFAAEVLGAEVVYPMEYVQR